MHNIADCNPQGFNLLMNDLTKNTGILQYIVFFFKLWLLHHWD